MRLSIVCFALGLTWLQHQPVLPGTQVLLVTIAVGMLLLLLAVASRRLRLLAPIGTFLIGVAWATAMADLRLADALDPTLEGRDVRIVGIVSGLPQHFENGTRFDFTVEQAKAGVPRHINLAWYHGWQREPVQQHGGPLELHAGERWQLTVRLKRPHGNLNPEGFDFEAWLLEAGVRATGVVRSSPNNLRRDAFVMSFGNVVTRLRENIRGRLLARLVDEPYAGVLVALTVGDQRAIESEQWQVFSRTGITHLISISGLHVTMFASLAYAALSLLWRRSPYLMLRLPAQKAAALCGLVAAAAYCLLAGFAVPAQRTLYMLAVVVFALWNQRTASTSRVLAIALFVVLVVDPWAVLSAGFWLSFGAVATLFYVASGRLIMQRGLGTWVRIQWAVTLGSIPALLLLFQQFSLVSPFANAIAIPVVSLIVTPLALAASAVPQLGFLLDIAHAVFAMLMVLLDWLARQPWAVWQQHAPPAWAWLAALAGVAWSLLPKGFPARGLGPILMLPMLFVPPARPPAGEAWITVLDVGQGLAMHIQTAHHDLVYDTGPTYSLEANGGNRVIVPYLRARGVRFLDGLIVTHEDNDHSGGAASLLEAVPVRWLMSSLTFEHAFSALPLPAVPCQDGQVWRWDGVRFEILHPTAQWLDNPTKKTNDMSCVLKISNNHRAALLTSDIEARSERELLARARERLSADILIAPHHGSRTSSTAAFIAAVAAPVVVFPVGYLNRFGHPRPDVVERYRTSAARLYRTDRDGAVMFVLANEPPTVTTERNERRRYWHGR